MRAEDRYSGAIILCGLHYWRDPVSQNEVAWGTEVSGCDARRTFHTKREAIVWYCAHVDRVRETARDWRNSPEMMAEVHRRGLELDKVD